jgi:hypothetical protein
MATHGIAQLIDTNFTNLHYLVTPISLIYTNGFRSWLKSYEIRDNLCNSCRDLMWFVAIRVIRVYDAGAVTND